MATVARSTASRPTSRSTGSTLRSTACSSERRASKSVGADVEVLARHDDDPVLVRRGNVMAASFHPELTNDTRLHELFVEHLQGAVDAMSGHSKWATIKHKKGAADKARGKLFAKLARQIEVDGACRRRRRRHQPDAAHRSAEGQGRPDDERRHRPGDQARHGRGRHHQLRVDHVRGLRAGRRRDADRGAHRQPQPHRAPRCAACSRSSAGRWPSRARSAGSSPVVASSRSPVRPTRTS